MQNRVQCCVLVVMQYLVLNAAVFCSGIHDVYALDIKPCDHTAPVLRSNVIPAVPVDAQQGVRRSDCTNC